MSRPENIVLPLISDLIPEKKHRADEPDLESYTNLPHRVNFSDQEEPQALPALNGDSKESEDARILVESKKRKPRLFKPSEVSCFIKTERADKKFLCDLNRKIPEEITCVEYLVYDDDFFENPKKYNAHFLQKIKEDFENLKNILKLNPHVKALLVKELPSDKSPAVMFSHMGEQYIPWYECLFPLLEGSNITHFAFRNLTPKFHPEINGGNIQHRGPLHPIDFLNHLYQLGIRFVDLDNTDLHNIFPSEPSQETSQIAAAVCCWVCCFPCALILCCCAPDVNRDPCFRHFDEASIKALREQDNKKVAEILAALTQFEGVGFSSNWMKLIAQRTFNKPDQRMTDLQPYTDAFLNHRPSFLHLNELPFNLATTDSIVEMFQNILKNDVRKGTRELVISNSPFFNLPVGTMRRIAQAVASSCLQRLTILGAKPSPVDMISQCEIILEQLKPNATLLECDILTGNDTLGKNAVLESDSPFHLNKILLKRYVKLLELIRTLIEKNLVCQIGVGEIAELKEAVDQNHTLDEVMSEQYWCAFYQSKIQHLDLRQRKTAEKQNLFLTLKKQVLDNQKKEVYDTLRAESPDLPPAIDRMILSFLF